MNNYLIKNLSNMMSLQKVEKVGSNSHALFLKLNPEEKSEETYLNFLRDNEQDISVFGGYESIKRQFLNGKFTNINSGNITFYDMNGTRLCIMKPNSSKFGTIESYNASTMLGLLKLPADMDDKIIYIVLPNYDVENIQSDELRNKFVSADKGNFIKKVAGKKVIIITNDAIKNILGDFPENIEVKFSKNYIQLVCELIFGVKINNPEQHSKIVLETKGKIKLALCQDPNVRATIRSNDSVLEVNCGKEPSNLVMIIESSNVVNISSPNSQPIIFKDDEESILPPFESSASLEKLFKIMEIIADLKILLQKENLEEAKNELESKSIYFFQFYVDINHNKFKKDWVSQMILTHLNEKISSGKNLLTSLINKLNSELRNPTPNLATRGVTSYNELNFDS